MPPPSAAFDALAPTYDADFTGTPIARYLRRRVHVRLDALYPPGASVLELGCGTGEDALHLARRGVHVTATDASADMLRAARDKVAQAELAAPPRFAHLDLHALPGDLDLPPLDGVFANFGVINVLEDSQLLACWLAGQVRSGGAVAFGVMAPNCLWEAGWHALHGDFATATRRWRPGALFVGGDAPPIPITYPSPVRLAAQFAPYFEQIYREPLGLMLPPSDAFGVVEARPALLRRLTRIEDTLARYPALARFADHYWIELRRTHVPAA